MCATCRPDLSSRSLSSSTLIFKSPKPLSRSLTRSLQRTHSDNTMAFRSVINCSKTLGYVKGLQREARNIGPGFRHAREVKTFTLPDLPYDYGALEPFISAEIMKLHHQRHHLTYIANYNMALELLEEAMANADSSSVVKLQSAIKFNGGGHINHSLFWKNLAPVNEGGGEPPKGTLGWVIDEQFGSLEYLVKKMNTEGAAVQGSGWVWLGLDKELKELVVQTTLNQDPLVTKGPHLVPLLGIDVWEHAYYLQYKNVKTDYLNNIWKVINWKYVGQLYAYEKDSS